MCEFHRGDKTGAQEKASYKLKLPENHYSCNLKPNNTAKSITTGSVDHNKMKNKNTGKQGYKVISLDVTYTSTQQN